MLGINFDANGFIPLIIILLVTIGLGIWLLAVLFPKATNISFDEKDVQKGALADSALQILTQRYARGEITKEEFEEKRHELLTKIRR